jgi:FMN phosphatase YigB (HAD superfamily)
MRTIWFNHERQATNNTDHEPTVEAHALADLPDLIASLGVAQTR